MTFRFFDWIKKITVPGDDSAKQRLLGLPGINYDKNMYQDVDFSSVLNLENAGRYEDNPDKLMAHNIYNNPNLKETTGNFTGFMIDFKADYRGTATYWALCNFTMDTSSLKEQYKKVSGGGAYCGLQYRPDGPKCIMSFWQWECDGKIITPTLVYPVRGGNGYFHNEGSGANYIADYKWEAGRWYRMFVDCFEGENGNTFVEMWVRDLETEDWDRLCCYDTKLKDSCLTGNMSQFMENYNYIYSTEARSFLYANIYVREKENGEWKYISDNVLSIDTCYGNKKGTYSFGRKGNCLYGITIG